jgi:hypothetical protein
LFDALADHEHHTEAMKKSMLQLSTSEGKDFSDIELPGFKLGFASGESGKLVDTLATMVEQQVEFAQTMGKILWLRSPALKGTMCRAISRYAQFLQLFSDNPETLLVPSLDIDLVWRTQQCDPARYRKTYEQNFVLEVDHGKLIENERSEDGLRETGLIYETRFKTEYFPCLCWECEAMKSAIESLDTTEAELKDVALKVTNRVRRYRAVELTRRVVR